MAIWPKNTYLPGTPEPSAPRTYVLVIGTSKYDGLPVPDPAGRPPLADDKNIFQLAQVESPAISAYQVASWFRSTYNNPRAPLGKIWLLLSASDKELANSPELSADAPTIEESTTANAEADLLEWQRACATDPNNVAVLYAAGHGVILSQEDAFVLLMDYTKKAQPLNGSLDIGAIKRGMVGPTMAQVQIYFSDACRLPAGDQKWQELGHGLAVSGRISGADHRSTAIYLSATPYEAAIALKGKGTLFSQALLDCLNRTAVMRPDDSEPSWHVTIDSLTTFLKQRLVFLKQQLKALANEQKDVALKQQMKALASDQEKQSMEGRTQGDSVTVHIAAPPQVALTITVKPAPNPAATWIRLWRGDRRKEVQARMVLPTHPVVVSPLMPGLYSLDVGFEPVEQPFENRQGIVVDAWQPPQTACEVEFP